MRRTDLDVVVGEVEQLQGAGRAQPGARQGADEVAAELQVLQAAGPVGLEQRALGTRTRALCCTDSRRSEAGSEDAGTTLSWLLSSSSVCSRRSCDRLPDTADENVIKVLANSCLLYIKFLK